MGGEGGVLRGWRGTRAKRVADVLINVSLWFRIAGI